MKTLGWLVAAGLLMPPAASAATYSFSYSDAGGDVVASGLLSTSNTLNAVNGYDIVEVEGTAAGSTITGLVPNPTQPFPSGTPSYTYDNVLFPLAALVFSRYGLAFTAGASAFNIFDAVADGQPAPPGLPYGLITAEPSDLSYGNFALTAVPEPQVWALLIAGFGLAGVSLRVRRRTGDPARSPA